MIGLGRWFSLILLFTYVGSFPLQCESDYFFAFSSIGGIKLYVKLEMLGFIHRSALHGLKTEMSLRCDFRGRSGKASRAVDGKTIMQMILGSTDFKMTQTM